MKTRPDNPKLVQLRSKTDRQLAELISRTLDAAARHAASPDSRDAAERACDDVRRLLPWLVRADRRRIEARLDEIDALLRPAARAACF